MNTLPSNPFDSRQQAGNDYNRDRDNRRYYREENRRNRRPIKKPDNYFGEGDTTWVTWEEYLT